MTEELSECDCCGKSYPADQFATVLVTGIETWACEKCRGVATRADISAILSGDRLDVTVAA